MQLDAAVGIVVLVARISVADDRVDAELFAQLARQAAVERLARLALAAGKFPVAFEVDARLPPRDEEAAVALDDGGGDDDASCHCRRPA